MRQYGNFPSQAYNPGTLSDIMQNPHMKAAALAEYEEMAQVANARLQKMSKTKFKKTDVYRYNVGRYKPVSEIKSTSELSHLLSDVHSFVNSRRSTVEGMREIEAETIETLHENGYEFVNRSNLRQFGQFMEFARSKKIATTFDSDRIADIFGIAKGEKVDMRKVKKMFEEYISKNGDRMSRKDMSKMTSAELWEELNNGYSSQSSNKNASTGRNTSGKKKKG